jgi:hypothetical protein
MSFVAALLAYLFISIPLGAEFGRNSENLRNLKIDFQKTQESSRTDRCLPHSAELDQANHEIALPTPVVGAFVSNFFPF